jgi:hypothetical protein
MSLHLRLAPGVRARIGRRGRTRWSLGPRLSRLHTGGGYRSGVSAGAGRVSLYHGLRRRRRRRRY